MIFGILNIWIEIYISLETRHSSHQFTSEWTFNIACPLRLFAEFRSVSYMIVFIAACILVSVLRYYWAEVLLLKAIGWYRLEQLYYLPNQR